MEEGKKKSLLEAGLVEIIFLAILIIIILAILAFLKVIPLPNVSLPFLPHSNSALSEKGQIPLPSIYAAVNAKVTAISGIPQYKLSLVSQNELVTKLKQMGIYGRVYTTTSGDKSSIDTINVYLTDVKQPEHKLLQMGSNGKRNTLYSSKTTFSKNNINISIYVSPKVLSDAKLSAAGKGAIVQEAMIVALYSYAHAYEPAAQMQTEYTEILKELGKNKQIYFAVN